MSKETEPKGSTSWWKALALCVAGLAGGLAAFLTDINNVAASLRGRCIETGICTAGSYYISTSISALTPSSPSIEGIISSNIQLEELVSSFSAGYVRNPEFQGLLFEPAGGVSGEGDRHGLPYQTATSMGYWSPEEGIAGWLLGLPIVDLLIAEKGKVVDITRIELKVLRSQIDVTPYVQIATPSDEFASILFVNESNHRSVNITIEFNVSDIEHETCHQLRGDINFRSFQHKMSEIIVNDTLNVSFEEVLSEAVGGFEFFQYRNYVNLQSGALDRQPDREPPPGYAAWEMINPLHTGVDFERTRMIYGKMIAEAESSFYETYFCADIPIDPPDGLGGGYLDITDSKVINLEFAASPYTIKYDLMYRLDDKNYHFRTALLFAADRSGVFDIEFSAYSFENKIWTSDPVRIHVFIPKTTVEQMGVNFAPRRASL